MPPRQIGYRTEMKYAIKCVNSSLYTVAVGTVSRNSGEPILALGSFLGFNALSTALRPTSIFPSEFFFRLMRSKLKNGDKKRSPLKNLIR